MSEEEIEEIVVCNFCRKKSDEVEKMFAADEHHTTIICNECVRLCAALLEDKVATETYFARIAGVKYKVPREKLRPITRLPKSWRIYEVELYATKPYITACSPDGKKYADFALPKQLANWMLANDEKLDIDKLREKIKDHISHIVRQTLALY